MFEKVLYSDNKTVIRSKNLNDIQDEIIRLGQEKASFEHYHSQYAEIDDITSNYYTSAVCDSLLDGKVSKIEGKGLSSVDFTQAYRDKLESLYNYDDSDLRIDVNNSLKLTEYYDELNTDEKTIIGAINELLALIKKNNI